MVGRAHKHVGKFPVFSMVELDIGSILASLHCTTIIVTSNCPSPMLVEAVLDFNKRCVGHPTRGVEQQNGHRLKRAALVLDEEGTFPAGALQPHKSLWGHRQVFVGFAQQSVAADLLVGPRWDAETFTKWRDTPQTKSELVATMWHWRGQFKWWVPVPEQRDATARSSRAIDTCQRVSRV